ncbi:hypothetical protein [Thiohalophilus thiocyanatoxydans]|uniref:MSHA biogenesis protein MshK n=1 Tax=Thiohalophilus thiocyanatoxydans TaxID=381308 RepID=A0A4R8J2I6_9GAMM|nr:hypothetical protein [Thiohalophilus thiocyanatoxydans]TDY04073.1 hypothetical protein EDC23_0445 [Thiohalophilus thiocyanatoxydans]
MFNKTGRIVLLWIMAGVMVPAAAQLDDPTRPPGYRLPGGTQTGPSWHVNTIKIGERERIAIINGKRVRVGDSVDGARVMDIQPGHVRLRYKQEVIAIRLVPETIHKQFR